MVGGERAGVRRVRLPLRSRHPRSRLQPSSAVRRRSSISHGGSNFIPHPPALAPPRASRLPWLLRLTDVRFDLNGVRYPRGPPRSSPTPVGAEQRPVPRAGRAAAPTLPHCSLQTPTHPTTQLCQAIRNHLACPFSASPGTVGGRRRRTGWLLRCEVDHHRGCQRQQRRRIGAASHRRRRPG